MFAMEKVMNYCAARLFQEETCPRLIGPFVTGVDRFPGPAFW